MFPSRRIFLHGSVRSAPLTKQTDHFDKFRTVPLRPTVSCYKGPFHAFDTQDTAGIHG